MIRFKDYLLDLKPSLAISSINCLIFDTLNYLVYLNGDIKRTTFIILLNIGTYLPFYYLFSLSKKLLWLIVPLSFLISGIASYFIINYRLDLSADTLAFLFESNVDEAKDFIGLTLVAWAAIAATIGAGTVLFFHRKSRTKRAVSIPVFLFTVAVYFVVSPLRYDIFHGLPKPLPYGLLYESFQYFAEKRHYEKLVNQKVDLSEKPFSSSKENITAVLVIGEAARSDHFSLNGYPRLTNPELQKKEVIYFPNMQSCDNKTRISVPCLMTRNTLADHNELLRESSFIPLFRQAGFNTAWLSNQRVMHKNDTVTTALAGEAEIVHFNHFSYANSRDELLIPAIRQQLDKKNEKKLLVIHTIGSHWAYRNRYDQSHELFTPTCQSNLPKACPPNELTNAYNNSIYYTDWFISWLIDNLKDRNAFLIYTSDHGESLGENGYYGHGQDADISEQRHVPLIFWASDSFKHAFASRYQSALSHKNDSLNHDYIFHSMLDCAGFVSSIIDGKLSICSSEND